MPQIGGPFAAAFMATSKDEFRKPERGMWDFFTAECNGGVQVGAQCMLVPASEMKETMRDFRNISALRLS